MAPELVAGGGYGGLIREKPHCALLRPLATRCDGAASVVEWRGVVPPLSVPLKAAVH